MRFLSPGERVLNQGELQMPRTSGVFRTLLCPHSSSYIQTSFLRFLFVCFVLLILSQYHAVQAQSATATLSGIVMDQNGALIRGANIAVINTAQGFQRNTVTNEEGTFVIPLLPPGNYTLKAEHEGFKPAEIRNVVLNVSAYINLQVSLNIGNLSDQRVDVSDTPSLIDQSMGVGGKVDSRLVGLPLNGRSFQSLFTLIPGVVLTKATGTEQGQFSVNGQRANANGFSIDGVSANISVPTNATSGQSASGSLPGLSAAGGTNNLVSIDALQEFKV